MLRKIESQRLAQMLKNSLETEEAKNIEISKKLHGELSPNLVYLKLVLNALRNQSLTEVEFKKIYSLIDEVIHAQRSLSQSLIPPVLSTGGISKALATLIKAFEVKFEKLIEYDCKTVVAEMPYLQNLMIYRILEKLMSTILQNSGLTRLRVTLAMQNEKLEFSLSHDGKSIKEYMYSGVEVTDAHRDIDFINTRLLALNGTMKHFKKGKLIFVKVNIPIDSGFQP